MDKQVSRDVDVELEGQEGKDEVEKLGGNDLESNRVTLSWDYYTFRRRGNKGVDRVRE